MFEICPSCGYHEPVATKPVTTHIMNVYYRDNGRGKAVFNTGKDKFTDDAGIVWTREDVFNKLVNGPVATEQQKNINPSIITPSESVVPNTTPLGITVAPVVLPVKTTAELDIVPNTPVASSKSSIDPNAK